MSNKASLEVRKLARQIVDDPEYRETLKIRLRVGEAAHMETLLWHYAYGKPQEHILVEQAPDPIDEMTADEAREQALAIAQQLTVLSSESSESETAH